MKNQLLGVIGYGFVALNMGFSATLYAGQEQTEDDMTVSISAAQYGKMPLLISIVGDKTADIKTLVDLVRQDLTWSELRRS